MKKCWMQIHTTPSPASFTNTWIGKERVSYTYLAYKWMLAILFLVGLLQSIVQNTEEFMDKDEIENVYKYFIYLTNNGRLVACIATTLEAVLVTCRWAKETFQLNELIEDEQGLPRLYKLLWTLCNINCSLSVMISLVYWITLYNPGRHYLDFENFSGHLLIALANLLDVFISDRPWRMVHAVHPIIFGGVFGIFSFIYFLAGGTNYYFEPYVYHIIDWAHPIRTLLVIGGVCIFLVIFHFIFYLLYRVREVCVKKKNQMDNTGVGSCNKCHLIEASSDKEQQEC